MGGCERKKNVKGKSKVFKVRNCKHEITTDQDMAILREELLKCCLKYHDYLVSMAALLGTLHWPHLEKRYIVDAQYLLSGLAREIVTDHLVPSSKSDTLIITGHISSMLLVQ